MASLDESIARLEQDLGAEATSRVLRQFVQVPGALSWLGEEAVHTALARSIATDEPPVAAALLALTAWSSLDDLAESSPAAPGGRREALLAGLEPGEAPSPDDVLILAGEILRADRAEGAAGVAALLERVPADWRAPLAVAFPALADRQALAVRLAAATDGRALTALVAALRSNEPEAAAAILAGAAGSAADRVIGDLVGFGETEFAAAVAASANVQPGGHVGKEVDGPLTALRSRLQAAWETRRAELALLTDAIASTAARDGDVVSAFEARRQALQLGPSDERLAATAMSLVERGDAGGALSLLPPKPEEPALALAAGTAYLRGGAVEKGRGMLIEAALASLDTGAPAPQPSLAASLVESGELGLAAEVARAYLAKVPSDSSARLAYAQMLIEGGDPREALAEARVALAVDPGSEGARQVQAEALARLGRPAEALALLKSGATPAHPRAWRKAVECAISLGDTDGARALMTETPDGVDATDLTLLEARALRAASRSSEAIAALEAAAAAHSGETRIWLGLADLHEDLGDRPASGETLRRATQMAPGAAALHARLAGWLRSEGRPSEALEAARKAVDIDRRDAQANHELGMTLLALGRASEAMEPLRLAQRRRPGDMENRLGLAAAFEASGEWDSARALLDHLPENAPAAAWFASGRLEVAGPSSPDKSTAKTAASRLLRARARGFQDPSLPYWLGLAYEHALDPEHAAESYRDFLRVAPPGSAQAKTAAFRKAACLLLAGDPAGAVRDFEGLRAADDRDPNLLGPLAKAYLQLSLMDEARQAAEDLLAVDDTDPEALRVLTHVAQQTGEWGRASAALYTAAARSPEDVGLWIAAAEAALKAHDAATAAKSIDKALSGSADVAVRRRAALVLVGLGDAVRAESLLKAATASMPDDASVWIELADVAERASDPQTSIDALTHAAALDAENADVHARVAAALWAAGRHDESVGAWQRAHALAPDDGLAHRSLAKALLGIRRTREALAEYAEALSRHPDDVSLQAEAGLATLRHSSATEAIDLLRLAAERQRNAQTLSALGEAWLRLDNPEQARQALQEATRLPGVTTGGWALLAEAAASLGDLASAEAAIVEARRLEAPSLDDRIALSRAELRLAHWTDSLTALAPVLASADPRGEIALGLAIVRTLEARWLYAEASLARVHAPRPEVPSEALLAWLQSAVVGRLRETEDGRAIAARIRLAVTPEDDEALSELRNAQHGAVRETGEGLAIAHLRRQESEQALDVLRQIPSDHLGATWLAPLAGLAHLQAGNPSLARQAFIDAADDAGLRPLARALLARAHLAQGYVESAVAALNAALALWPDEPAWHAMLADLYLSGKELDAALPHLQAAAEAEPDNAAWRLTLGRALREAGHLSEAQRAYDRLLPLMPSEPDVWHEAGDIALAGGDFTKAGALFDRAAALAPHEPAHAVGKARAALASGNLREARKSADGVLQNEPDHADALQCLAAVAARQGDVDRAVELLDRAALTSKDAAALRAARSELLIEAGRPAQAADELRAYLASEPDDERAWASLAEALETLKDYPAAGQALEAALRLAPRSAALRVRLARVERKSGQLDHALDLLRQAEGLDPLEADLALELGHVYEARRELDHALDAYLRSAEADPRKPEPFRRAGHVFKSLKAYSDAEHMLEHAAELDPADTATLQQLAAVRALELVHGGSHRMAVTP